MNKSHFFAWPFPGGMKRWPGHQNCNQSTSLAACPETPNTNHTSHVHLRLVLIIATKSS